MKVMRPLIFALAFAGAFFYFTTWRSNSQAGERIPRPGSVIPRRWRSPKLRRIRRSMAKSRTISPSTRRIFPSVVNITSRAMTLDFFYGLVPQEGRAQDS